MSKLLVSSSSLYSIYIFPNTYLHLSFFFFIVLQLHVTSELTIHGALYVGYYCFLLFVTVLLCYFVTALSGSRSALINCLLVSGLWLWAPLCPISYHPRLAFFYAASYLSASQGPCCCSRLVFLYTTSLC